MLVPAVQQRESAMCIHMSPPLGPPHFTPLSHSRLPLPLHLTAGGHWRAELLGLYSRFPLAIHFTHGGVYVSLLFSQFILLSLYPHDWQIPYSEILFSRPWLLKANKTCFSVQSKLLNFFFPVFLPGVIIIFVTHNAVVSVKIEIWLCWKIIFMILHSK